MKGKLYLVPAPLGGAPEEVIPSYVFGQIAHITYFAVEELRTARRYLSSIGFKGRIDGLNFYSPLVKLDGKKYIVVDNVRFANTEYNSRKAVISALNSSFIKVKNCISIHKLYFSYCISMNQ